jgi:cytochrome c biogenesis protein CcmG/thiol:disulfide interchange protein DsbE
MRINRVLQACLGICLVTLIVVIGAAVRETIVNVGDRAPDFEVRADNGRLLTLDTYKGRVVVLNFWATWCPPCIEELPSLNALARQLEGSGVVVLGVSVDRNEAAYRQFVKSAGVAFETARDPDGLVSSSYGTYKFPETYVIDKQGVVRQKHISSQNWMDPQMIAGIKALL